jgi:signal transduction histidine kinase
MSHETLPANAAELGRQSQKMEVLGQLVSGIAHEINTPTQFIGDNLHFLNEGLNGLFRLLAKYEELQAVVGDDEKYTAIMQELAELAEAIDKDFLIAELPGAVERSVEGNQRVAEVVRSLREFAHPSDEEKVPTDINHAITAATNLARNEWKYVADLTLDLADELPRVCCIPGAFNQVILNLLVNAAHAISDVVGTEGAQKGEISVSTKQVGNEVEIRIRDTGAGIPERLQEKIFEPFFTTKEVGRGTGQGLAIVKSIVVDTHDGVIGFDSKPGEGTTFVLRFPIGA